MRGAGAKYASSSVAGRESTSSWTGVAARTAGVGVSARSHSACGWITASGRSSCIALADGAGVAGPAVSSVGRRPRDSKRSVSPARRPRRDDGGAGRLLRGADTICSARAMASAMSRTSRMSFGSSSWVRFTGKGVSSAFSKATRNAFFATLSPSLIIPGPPLVANSWVFLVP